MTVDTDTALRLLDEGNRRFMQGGSAGHFDAEKRAATMAGQEPWAVIVGCSDSRVPVEAVFDVGAGELFVVRTAGHVLAEASVASVRFAVEKLGARTVVVLGHEDCGAVAAALAGSSPEWLAPIIDHIDVAYVDASHAPHDADDALLAAAVDLHVLETVSALREQAAVYDLPPGEQVTVVGGAYKLATGEVHWLAR